MAGDRFLSTGQADWAQVAEDNPLLEPDQRLAGRDLVRSLRLGFLGSWRFGFEEPAHKLWIVLDFLGFSRPNPDFSMGCAARSRVNIIARLIVALEAPDRRRTVLACGRVGL